MINQQQLQLHAEGFGGSDARIFKKIAERGLSALTASDKRRILQALGRAPLGDDFTTAATQKGHAFEQWMAELPKIKAGYAAEQCLGLARLNNFKVFAHADFYSPDGGTVVECKCTHDDNIEDVADAYEAQLQWYYMLGAHRVILAWHPSDRFDFSTDALQLADVHRNDDLVDALRNACHDLDQWITKEGDGLRLTELTATELLPHEQQELTRLGSLIRNMKAIETQINDFKAELLRRMEEGGITKIEAPDVTITYVAPSVARTFDKKALQAAHPEIDLADYERETHRGAYVKFS